jgi:hypothetical protein
MKIAILLTAFLALSVPGFTQTQEKYIEVTVSDTMQIDAEEITYVIIIDNNISKDDSLKDVQEARAAQLAVKKLITELKPDTVKTENFGINSAYNEHEPNTYFTLQFKSETALSIFKKKLEITPRISGHILSVNSSKKTQAEKELVQKLLARAKKEVQFIAEQTNKKFLELIYVKDMAPEGS